MTDQKLTTMTTAAIALGLSSTVDPMAEMKMEGMREVVERRRAFDKAIDSVLKQRIPSQGKNGDILPLVLHPDARLNVPCEPIEEFDGLWGGSLKGLIADMAFTMYLCGGAGLAANQVGLPFRMFVMDVDARVGDRSNLQVWINPEVIEASPEMVRMEEGCLSMPGLKPRIMRHNRVLVRARTRKGKIVERWLTGWNARVFLHELDHLDGKTMLDRVGPMELRLASKKLAKIRKNIEGKVKNRKRAKRHRS